MTTDSSTGAVAIVCDGWDIRYIGAGPIAPLIERHGVKIGTKLVTQDRLLAALERAGLAESIASSAKAEADALRAEVERLTKLCDAVEVQCEDNFARAERAEADLAESRHDYEIQSQYVEALKVRVAGLSRDAERYRWLKEEAPDEWDVMRWISDDLQEIIMLSDLDTAIDAAMAGEVGGA